MEYTTPRTEKGKQIVAKILWRLRVELSGALTGGMERLSVRCPMRMKRPNRIQDRPTTDTSDTGGKRCTIEGVTVGGWHEARVCGKCRLAVSPAKNWHQRRVCVRVRLIDVDARVDQPAHNGLVALLGGAAHHGAQPALLHRDHSLLGQIDGR